METRAAILNSCETLVRTRGYEGFSYADIAEVVGIRKASIHHHFAKKSDLVEACLREYTGKVLATLDDISVLPPKDRLQVYIDIYRQACADGTSLCFCVSMSSDRSSLNEAMVDLLRDFHAQSTGWLSQLFHALGVDDPEGEALAAMALVEGAQLIVRAQQDISYFDRAVSPVLKRHQRA